MKRVNYISNLALNEASGGWSGINVSMHKVLSKHFHVNFAGPINPHSDYRTKLISKLQRMTGAAGSFHFFSERRLKRIARQASRVSDERADFDFFLGSTPWIKYEPKQPYFLYTDTCFSTYVNVYHNRSLFIEDDLKRIFELEARWLAGASGVFFGTEWALKEVARDYALSSSNLKVVGAGGNMPVPGTDEYEGGMDFLFVAHDFERKGGPLCVEAFKQVWAEYPEARLLMLGAKPPLDVLNTPGIAYLGMLRKTEPVELKSLQNLFSKSFALVHPTKSDIQPLVIAEAGYYGCPTIASKSFGIPELVKDGITGYLVEPPLYPGDFANCMLELCRGEEKYLSMRVAARAFAISNLTWDASGERITTEIHNTLG